MGTLNEDLSAIKEVEDKIIANKVARFAYTEEAYTTNDANGVAEYDVSKEQNIPTADASVLKVNETVLSKGYRAQASSVTRMLLNHFFGRMSYNLNKVNDIVSNLIATLIGHRGTANGFATLDENGRIPYSQLPESAMEYKGQWNAETNTPTLADGTGTKGDFYIVSVGGTQNLGSGDIQFSANDRIIYDGSVWARLSAGAVQTVNNISPENGNVTLTGENIPVSSTDPTLLSAALKSNLQYIKSINIEKIDGSSDTCYYLIAKTLATSSTGNLESLLVNGSDFMNRMFEGSIRTREGNHVYNYGKDNLPIELYEQTDGTIYVYWLVRDYYTRVALNITATSGVTIYGGNLSPVTPTGSKMTLTEHDYKPHPYSGMVHTCSTGRTTKDKTVSISGFTLTQGACIRVVFNNGNSAMYPTLKVNDTSVREILCARGTLDTEVTENSGSVIKKGHGVCTWDTFTVLDLYYDGAHWLVLGDPIVKRFYNGTADLRKNFTITGIIQTSYLYS